MSGDGRGRPPRSVGGQGRSDGKGRPSGPRKPPGAGGDRERRDQRIVVGLHPVRELLRSGQTVFEVLVASGREGSDVVDEIVSLAEASGVPLVEVDRDRIDDIAGDLVHQGVLARAMPFPYADLDRARSVAHKRGEPLFLVALDGVTDPHNLGAIARSAEGFGAHGLIIPGRRAAAVTPLVEKAAAGALAHLPLVRVPNLVSALRSLQQEGVWVVGLDSDESVAIEDCNLLVEPLVLCVGSEGKGLANLTHVTCDMLVRLPMRGRVGSFNASVAASVAFHEVVRRRASGHSDGVA